MMGSITATVHCCGPTLRRKKMKAGKVRMDVIMGILGVVVAVVAIIVTKMLDLNGFVTAAIVILAILFAVFSLARMGAKKPTIEEDAGK